MVWKEKTFNFSAPEEENIEFRVRREKILNFRGLQTENIDFWRSGRRPGELREGSPGTFSERFGGFEKVLRGFWRF